MLKRVISFTVALTLAAGQFALAAGDFVLAGGAAVKETAFVNSAGGAESERYIEYNPALSQLRPVVKASLPVNGAGVTLSAAQKALESAGYEVAAGINGGFFDTATGIPINAQVTDGIVRVSDPGDIKAIGFRADGTAVLGYPKITAVVSRKTGGEVVRTGKINRPRRDNAVHIFTPDYGADTGDGAPALFVTLSANLNLTFDGAAIPATVMSSVKAGRSAIGAGTFVLAAAETSTAFAQLGALRPGDELYVNVAVSDAAFKDCTQIIGAYHTLIERGVIASGLETARHPRTAFGLKADGTCVFYTVDGRQSGYSVGLGLDELARRLYAAGCVEAVELDGGGSTNIGAKIPGEYEFKQLGKPSDGSARKSADYIFLVNVSPRLNAPARLYFGETEKTMLAGTALPFFEVFPYTYTDLNWHTYYGGDGGIVWASSDVTRAYVTEGKLYAAAGGAAKLTAYNAALTLNVIDEPDEIRLFFNDAEIKSLNLGAGKSAEIEARAYYKGERVYAGGLDFGAQTTTNAFTAEAAGGGVKITAGLSEGASGYVVVSLGAYSVSLPVTVGSADVEIAGFEFGSAAFIPSEGAGFYREADRADVKFGHGAGAFTFSGGGKTSQYAWTLPPVVLPKEYLNFWIKSDTSGGLLNATLIDAGGGAYELNAGELYDSDWTFVSLAAVPGSSFTGFKLVGGGTGKFIVDGMVSSSNAWEDTDAPAVSLAILGAADGDTLTVKGSAKGAGLLRKTDVTLTFDGKPLQFTYDPVSGDVSASLATPAEGMHRLTLEARDAYGNTGRVSKVYERPTIARPESFADIAGQWFEPYVELLDRVGVFPHWAANNFVPNGTITRYETAMWVSRALKLDETKYAGTVLPYADLADIPAAALPAVRAMYETGIMRGSQIGDKRYLLPNSTLTRAEAFKIFGNIFPAGYAIPETPLAYSDAALIPDYAEDAVRILSDLKILEGDNLNRINPGDAATRAVIAKLLCAAY